MKKITFTRFTVLAYKVLKLRNNSISKYDTPPPVSITNKLYVAVLQYSFVHQPILWPVVLSVHLQIHPIYESGLALAECSRVLLIFPF